jgi:DNA polymerase elongation subunit (family B)
LFVKVIELRTTVKKDRDKHLKGSPEYNRLDAMQLASKLLANATSYGVLVEFIVDEHKAEVPCDVYHGGKKTHRVARKRKITLEGEGAIITLTQQNLSCTVLKRDRPVNFGFCRSFGPSVIRIGPPICRWCCQRVPPAREALG